MVLQLSDFTTQYLNAAIFRYGFTEQEAIDWIVRDHLLISIVKYEAYEEEGYLTPRVKRYLDDLYAFEELHRQIIWGDNSSGNHNSSDSNDYDIGEHSYLEQISSSHSLIDEK